jgi:hypothetical protein
MSTIDMEWRRRRLSDAAEKAGGKAQLGRKLGYKDGAFVGQMIRGDRPISEKTIEAITSLPGFSNWFEPIPPGEKGANMEKIGLHKITAARESEPPEAKQSQSVTIPQFDTGGAMGHGVILRDQPGVIRSWTVSDDWLHQNVHRITSPKNLAIVTGFGPSMMPLFNPGDPLLVDRGVKKVDIDGVYFFRVGDEGFVKQLQRIPTTEGLILRAKSYNPLYDPFDITEGMDFEVFGRIVKVWKGEDF